MSASLLQLRQALEQGETTASEAVTRALDQISQVNDSLAAVSQVFREEALARAQVVDTARAAGDALGPLAGVPFTVKDNICTADGETTAGSRILKGYGAPYRATVVRRLEEAGAILVGKTNMDEFGMGSSTENSALGPSRNPWKLTHVPGGSSGGAASLSAATRGLLHLGSDTGGSIRQPASYCGVTGLKPTYGRVSRYGLLAFASSLDQIGLLQASAADCALGLETIAGRDPLDSTSADVDVPGYVDALQKDLAGLKIGVAAEYFPEGVDSQVRERVEAAIDVFRGLGVEVKKISMPHTQYANPTYVLISAAEASSNLARYDGVHYGHRTADPEDVAAMYTRSRAEGFGDEVKRRVMVGTFVLSSGYYDAFYKKACKVRQLIRGDFDAAFEEVDAIICPTSPVPAFPLGDRLDDPLKLYAVDALTVPANLATVPGISFPCGTNDEQLPIGVQLYGRPFDDATILRLAHVYQQSTDFHLQAPTVSAWSQEGGVS